MVLHLQVRIAATLLTIGAVDFVVAVDAPGHPIPVQSDSVFRIARMAGNDGRFQLAADLLQSTVKRVPEFGLAWAYLGTSDFFLFRV